MEFSPCFDETPLSLGKAPANDLYSIYTDNSRVILIVCMKVGTVMRFIWLREHTNYNSQKNNRFQAFAQSLLYFANKTNDIYRYYVRSISLLLLYSPNPESSTVS
jgi:hypothetical protein